MHLDTAAPGLYEHVRGTGYSIVHEQRPGRVIPLVSRTKSDGATSDLLGKLGYRRCEWRPRTLGWLTHASTQVSANSFRLKESRRTANDSLDAS